jgi:DNA-binding MarR family transcriptional regulator
MEEIIVHVCRTVACEARLRILARLSRSGELAPTTLADQLKLPVGLLCSHLRRLSAAGLIQRRRSARWCYCVAQSPYASNTLSGQIERWLFRVLRDPETTLKRAGLPVADKCSLASAEAELVGLIFAIATAFTNVRRVQVLREISQGAAVTIAELTDRLHLSEAAASRHLCKLMRRGFVTAVESRWPRAYQLAKRCRTPLHSEFLQMVRNGWQGRKLHS